MRLYVFFAFSFLLKILSGGSFISRIRRKYGQEVVSLIHRVDRLTHRHVKLLNDITFLDKCIQLRVAPNFVRFKTANSHLGFSTAYSKSQRLLLKEELRNKHRERGRISLQVENIKSEVSLRLSTLDRFSLRLWLSISARKFDESVKVTHNNKLRKLSPDFCVDPLKPDEVILNLSSYRLSEAEKNALINGLNYTLSTGDLNDLEFNASLELAARKLKTNISNENAWLEAKRVLQSSIPNRTNIKLNNNDKRKSIILTKLGKNDSLYI